jgi:tetratricopeptide (TPR) repeat protein
MESDIRQSEGFYRAWGWFETNKKVVGWAIAVIVFVGLVAWFVIWRQNENEMTASEALARVFIPPGGGTSRPDAQAYLQVAARYPNSSAGAQALLLAAGTLFAEGKFSDAQGQFSRFIRDHRDSPLMGEALLGVAACLDAEGKADQAATAYKDLIDHHPGENVIPQAKFALARIYESQNKIEPARTYYEDVARGDPNTSLASEAGMRLEELRLKYPPPAPAAPPVSFTPTPKVAPSASNAAPFTLTPAPALGATGSPGPLQLTPAPKVSVITNAPPGSTKKP